MMFSIEEARKLLTDAGLFFSPNEDGDDEDEQDMSQMLNLNDVWGWACADGEIVPEEELPKVAELFWSYGRCGILFWVSEKRGNCRSEFHDINRFVDFARAEEKIREELPGSSARAYAKREYVIGTTP